MSAKKGTALYHATTDVPLVTPYQTVGEVVGIVRSKKWKSSHHVFIVENLKEKRLVGVVSTRVLLSSADSKKISEVLNRDYPSVKADTPENKVAILAIRRDLDTIPVIFPETGEFLGTVDAEDLLKILHEEHTEQLLKRAGILRDEHILNIFKARVFEILRVRIPWLLVGFAGGLMLTFLVSRFEAILQQAVELAYFIPVIAYMNAAVGTQAVSIFVRGLSLEEFSLRQHIGKELSVGLLMGAFFGLLIFVFALLAFGSVPIAQTVGLSLFAGVAISTLNAMFTPYVFHRLGKDPALGSDPLVTILQDILSIVIYFAIASVLVLK